ncbi:hypothetical protein CERSUDRAFT_113528 [Gelatoporia subvermispora B]|uniref:FAS1-like dehydratase domain-containing protein n=1 Tax=Ceriporiopsis subvermispora (strain B) TaxID=914234 RepID=M2RIR3_CERS8|nr:hypothetical protein CERSUDRAFT_113528 [Gelatoporia subvermispora B]
MIRATTYRLFQTSCRRFNSSFSALNVEALDKWTRSEQKLVVPDTLRPEHLASLYATLPTRDGSAQPPDQPREGTPLSYGHHLVFFHPRNPERMLRPDGTDADFCPPEPWTRRMWAGGKFEWKKPLMIGDRVTAVATIDSVQKKGFGKGTPMVFVKQIIEFVREGDKEASIVEERSHVYLATPGNRRVIREVGNLPEPDLFVFPYRPSATTLFRFSALTFNGHFIHLDKDFAQKSEGYPERLVHGPLTALMLLEAAAFHMPDAKFRSMEYRAVNPMVVNRSVKLSGARENSSTITVWAEDENKVVGMTGRITLQ